MAGFIEFLQLLNILQVIANYLSCN